MLLVPHNYGLYRAGHCVTHTTQGGTIGQALCYSYHTRRDYKAGHCVTHTTQRGTIGQGTVLLIPQKEGLYYPGHTRKRGDIGECNVLPRPHKEVWYRAGQLHRVEKWDIKEWFNKYQSRVF